MASFTYYKYNDIFADREGTFSNDEYDEILANNPGMAESIIYNDPNITQKDGHLVKIKNTQLLLFYQYLKNK